MTNTMITPTAAMIAVRDHRYTDAARALRAANPRTTPDARAATMGRLIDMIHPDA